MKLSKIENRILNKLVYKLAASGWTPTAHFAASGWTPTAHFADSIEEKRINIREMKLALQSCPDVWFQFAKKDSIHSVRLVAGNGIHIITDWTYSKYDSDGFNTVMEKVLADVGL